MTHGIPGLMLAMALLVGTSAASAQTTATPPAAPSHHREGGYQNNHIDFAARGMGQLALWKLQALRDGLPPPPRQPIAVVAPDLNFIHANAKAGAAMKPAVTWLGHASVLIQAAGLNILADPIFSERASPLSYLGPKRAQPPGLQLKQLPHIDLVVVSHNHYDHCDLPTLKALNEQPGGPPRLVLPLGNKAWAQAEGLAHVVELDWWQTLKLGELELLMTPVQHWSGRGLNDRLRTLWGGYAFLTPSARIYFSGDTGYSADFAATASHVAQRLGLKPQADSGAVFDLALLAIGAYEPRWFMKEQHLNPAEAVQAHFDLRAARSIGIHWGTFELTDEALDEPPRALAQARRERGMAEDAFRVLAIGQTYRLPPRAVN